MVASSIKNKSLVIVGDAYFAEIAYEYFTYDSPYKVVCFAVEKAYIKRDTLFGLPVVALEEVEKQFPPGAHDAFVALTYNQLNRVRRRLYETMRAKGYTLANYISSRAFVWRNVTMGDNVFIFEDNTVQPFVTLGSNIILWSGNHIGHHSNIASHNFISSHVVISGLCNIGESCFMGVNATIANNVNVGADNFIGFGVKIAKDTPDDTLLLPAVEAPREGSSARRFCKVP
jgi:sugar O-acyltransferase (sialic acid O-acetyltransferase NeuD family)